MSSKSFLCVVLVIVAQFTQLHSLPTTQNPCNVDSFSPRKQFNSSQLYVFGGTEENNKYISSASRLNSTTGKWEAINSMPIAETQSCGAVIDKNIFLFGGSKGADGNSIRIGSADVYHCLTDTYTVLRPMPEARDGCGAAALNGSVYVVGGAIGTNSSAVSSLLRYDTHTNQWSTLNPMNNSRKGHQFVELGGLLYAIGGDAKQTVEVYNATTDRWAFVANTQHQHFWFGAAVHQGKIYVNSYVGFEMYSPSTNQWTTLTPPVDHIYDSRALVSMNGELWAIGGRYKDEGEKWIPTKAVYSYDPVADQWTKQRDTDAFRAYHTAFVVNH